MIDKDIPLPSRARYPFAELEVGDSFTVPMDRAHSCRNRACVHAGKTGRKYTTRRQGDVLRVWRVK